MRRTAIPALRTCTLAQHTVTDWTCLREYDAAVADTASPINANTLNFTVIRDLNAKYHMHLSLHAFLTDKLLLLRSVIVESLVYYHTLRKLTMSDLH